MIIEKIQEFIKSRGLSEKNVYISLLIVIVAFLSFGLGKLSVLQSQKHPVRIEGVREEALSPRIQLQERAGQGDTVDTSQAGLLVGSKNSTKYHYPWCSGAQRIKEDNKIWFESAEDAQAKGYTAAANCPGL